ncbi:hypothetical protein [Natrinema sp. 1APR25-10V2]|uniref:hypothetical protein n=1 Tax=Natrinema sp. 1APR25-10V2 TaxID=2951081 RepID=UPI0028765373|nr:hypothetical protein [Natrinema sp. 1APR25-10V2]MDS0477571.1 hypothetical protein [Natrinema sp. 1APR25-10V2]
MPSLRPRTLAAGTALLGAISLLTAAMLYVSVPENPPGDGFAAGIAAIFAVVCAVAGFIALAEAGLLFLVTRLWNPTARAQRFLTGGAVAGSLSVVLLAVPVLVARSFDVLIPGPPWGLGIGLVLVPVGAVCSALGVVFRLLDGSRTEARA